MWRKLVLTFLVVTSFQSAAVAVHDAEGIIQDYFPWTIGSPDFNGDVYSGIRLTIKPEAPADLRFKTGQAAWLGFAETTIIDSELELSVFTLGLGAGLQLVQNEIPPGPINTGGLLPVRLPNRQRDGIGYCPSRPKRGEVESGKVSIRGGNRSCGVG